MIDVPGTFPIGFVAEGGHRDLFHCAKFGRDLLGSHLEDNPPIVAIGERFEGF